MSADEVLHFFEDPTITHFAPHVAVTAPRRTGRAPMGDEFDLG